MTRQWLRRVRVQIDNLRFDESLRIAFEVQKKDGSSQNECRISIYNPSPASIEAMRVRNAPVLLFAGYGEVVPMLYKGIITRVTVEQADGDVIARIESTRGFLTVPQVDPQAKAAKAVQSYISRVFAPGVSVVDGLKTIVDDTKAFMGKLGDQIVSDFTKVPATTARAPRAVTLAGTPEKVMSAYADANGLDWWEEDGVIRAVPKGDASRETAFVLSPDTGLIGSPKPKTAGKTQKGAAAMELTCLLNGELRTRRAVQLTGVRDGSGWYLIRKVSHKGDSGWSDEFYTTIEATPIRAVAAQPKTSTGQLGLYVGDVVNSLFEAASPTWPTFTAARKEIIDSWFPTPGMNANSIRIVQRADGRWTTALSAGVGPVYTVRRPR